MFEECYVYSNDLSIQFAALAQPTQFIDCSGAVEEMCIRDSYITIEVRNNLDMDNMSDVKASANGQILKGLRGDVVFTQDQWGTMINHSFLKYVSTVKLVYDNETKCIYANNTLVIDLDNPLHFDTPFKGFTNGTATLTIETVETVASEVSLMVKNIDGVSLESAVIKDITGPQIIVDTQGYKEPVSYTHLDVYKRQDPNRTQIYVALYNGGLGRDWLDAADEAFEAQYT